MDLLRFLAALLLWVGFHGHGEASQRCAWIFPRDLPLVETNALYWRLDVDLAPGAHLEVAGRFPHARQMSFNVHDRRSVALLAGIADTEIAPRLGHTNPFLPGASRLERRRAYAMSILRADEAGPSVNAVRVPARNGSLLSLRLLYRVYLPDAGKPGGGVGLPIVWRVQADGRRERVSGANCPRDGGKILSQEIGATRLPAGPSTFSMPLDWRNAGASESAANSDVYVNRDNGYAYALTHIAPGSLLLLGARAPTHPRTRAAAPVMGAGEVRYWSLCAYRHPSDRSARCLADEDIPVDPSGQFRVVLGPPGSARLHLRKQCGVAWLEAPAHGDGAIVLRHVAPDPSFAHTPLRGAPNAPSMDVMGPYLPRATPASASLSDAEICARFLKD
jgi:hypothetical protein